VIRFDETFFHTDDMLASSLLGATFSVTKMRFESSESNVLLQLHLSAPSWRAWCALIIAIDEKEIKQHQASVIIMGRGRFDTLLVIGPERFKILT